MTTPTLSREPAFPDLEKRAALELGERFRIDGLLGRGPQSAVFRVFPASSQTAVALKVVPKGAHDAAFLRSASAAAEMEHPHVVPILQAGQTKHLLWYTMPVLEDPSLDRVISSEGRLDVKRCQRIVEQIASALQYGHRRGLAHGGIKPENIFVNPAGWTLVSDFGLPNSFARVADGTLPDRLLAYAAPEVLEGSEPIPASDQYALAVLAHECLTGSVPASPDSSAESEVPLRIAHALRRAMAPSPQERFPTVLSFLAALDGGPTPSTATFAPVPNAKHEPRVLTMEPESRAKKIMAQILVLALIVGLVAAWPRIWQSSRLEGFRDRFDHWYEADGPAPMASSSAPAVVAPAGEEPGAAASADAAPRVTQPRPAASTRTAARPAAAPRVAPRVAPVRPPEPPADQPPPAPAKLLVSSTPWGILYVDGRPVGNTPLRDVPVSPGNHVIRITHEGFEPFEGSIEVIAGQELRLTGIALREMKR